MFVTTFAWSRLRHLDTSANSLCVAMQNGLVGDVKRLVSELNAEQISDDVGQYQSAFYTSLPLMQLEPAVKPSVLRFPL